MEQTNTSHVLTPGEMYLTELPVSDHPKAIAAFEVVAGVQGLNDWRLAQWEQITVEDLPVVLEQLRATFTNPEDTRLAVSMIKGAARCAWREKLISGHQLALISKWKSEG